MSLSPDNVLFLSQSKSPASTRSFPFPLLIHRKLTLIPPPSKSQEDSDQWPPPEDSLSPITIPGHSGGLTLPLQWNTHPSLSSCLASLKDSLLPPPIINIGLNLDLSRNTHPLRSSPLASPEGFILPSSSLASPRGLTFPSPNINNLRLPQNTLHPLSSLASLRGLTLPQHHLRPPLDDSDSSILIPK